MDIPKRITELREKKGLTVTDLAKSAGISQPYLRQIEMGVKKNPSAEVLVKLAKGLGVTVADILGSPIGVSANTLATAPQSLRDLVRRKGKKIGLRQEDVEMLSNINYRGRQPGTPDDWELIFLILKRLLG